jgi:hypothetical protein
MEGPQESKTRADGVVQAGKRLPSKDVAMSSNPSVTHTHTHTNLEIELPYCPAMPRLGVCLKECEYIRVDDGDICTPMFEHCSQ